MENTTLQKNTPLAFFTNKYFVIALILIVIVLIYLYYKKKTCDVEGMQNVDLTVLSQSMAEKPWSDDYNDDKYKRVGNDFDLKADRKSKNDLVSRKDIMFDKYQKSSHKKSSHRKSKTSGVKIPQPMDELFRSDVGFYIPDDQENDKKDKKICRKYCLEQLKRKKKSSQKAPDSTSSDSISSGESSDNNSVKN